MDNWEYHTQTKYMVDTREMTAYRVSEGGEKISSYELVLSGT